MRDRAFDGARFGVPAVLLLCAVLLIPGCDGNGGGTTEPPTPTISISLSPTSLTLDQGTLAAAEAAAAEAAAQNAPTTGTVTVNLTRGGEYSGSVSVSIDSPPTGVSATPMTIASGATSGTLTLQVTSAASAGTSSLTVRATGSGVTDATATLSLTVEEVLIPDFSIAVSPTSVSAQVATSTTSTLTVTRLNGHAADVTLAASGQPAGMTVTFDPATVPGASTTSTVQVVVGGAVTPGTYDVTITGSSTGSTDKTATLSVEVTPIPGELVRVNFCAASGIPDWVAFRDGDGDWTPVPAGAGGTIYEFFMTEIFGSLAIVTEESGTAHVEVFHAARSELGYRGEDYCTGGGVTKMASGAFDGVGPTDIASVSMGGSSATVFGGTGVLTFDLNTVRDGPVDLFATLSTLVASGAGFATDPVKMIIRRDLDPPDPYTIPLLDFDIQGFFPAEQPLTINNLLGHKAQLLVSYHTANGSTGNLFTDYQFLPDVVRRYPGVPGPAVGAGEYHTIFVNSSAEVDVVTSYRGAMLSFTTPTPKIITLGPLMAPMDVGPLLWAGPYVRFFMRIPFQAEYDDFYHVTIQQEGGRMNSLSLGATKAYLDGESFDFQTPDFTGVAGWNDDWGIQAGLPETTLVIMDAMGWTGAGGITGMPFAEDALTLYSRFRGRFGGF